MVITSSQVELGKWIEHQSKTEKIVGFVPAPGAPHAGHISLTETCRKEYTLTVCSIFVNLTQFHDLKDFKKYPSTLDADIVRLEAAGGDPLFPPSAEEIYSDGWERPGDISVLKSSAAFILAEEGFRVDYISVADRLDLT